MLQKIYFELDGVTALDCYVLRAGPSCASATRPSRPGYWTAA